MADTPAVVAAPPVKEEGIKRAAPGDDAPKLYQHTRLHAAVKLVNSVADGRHTGWVDVTQHTDFVATGGHATIRDGNVLAGTSAGVATVVDAVSHRSRTR